MASFASTKAAWTQKVRENNDQLRFRPPPQVEHTCRLDQNLVRDAIKIDLPFYSGSQLELGGAFESGKFLKNLHLIYFPKLYKWAEGGVLFT